MGMQENHYASQHVPQKSLTSHPPQKKSSWNMWFRASKCYENDSLSRSPGNLIDWGGCVVPEPQVGDERGIVGGCREWEDPQNRG